MQPRATSLYETIPPESEECLCNVVRYSRRASTRLKIQIDRTRPGVAYRISEASFSPYPSSPWWWPNYGREGSSSSLMVGAVHLCAIAQFEEARFFIESEFWRCDFLTYCRGHHRIGRIEQATMTTARGTGFGYTLSVPMISPLLLLVVIFSRVPGFIAVGIVLGQASFNLHNPRIVRGRTF